MNEKSEISDEEFPPQCLSNALVPGQLSLLRGSVILVRLSRNVDLIGAVARIRDVISAVIHNIKACKVGTFFSCSR